MAITWLAGALLLAWTGTGAAGFPVPDRTTPVLQRLLRSTAERAVNASAAAVPDLLAFLDRHDFRRELGKLSPRLASRTSQELVRAFRAEVSVMELVHNWIPEPKGNYFDLTLGSAEVLEFFPNLWELYALDFNVSKYPGGHVLLDTAEQKIYGLPPFNGTGKPTFREAEQRPVYIALNMYKVDMGNPGFGAIATVFSGSFAREMVMISAFDTGLLEAHCDPDLRAQCGKLLSPEMCKELERTMGCRAWPGTLGTLQHSDHLLLSQLQNYLEAPAEFGARLFARALEDSVPVTSDELDLYWEANIFGGAHYPEAVKFHIASFPQLFGKRDGDRLRAWCVRHGWPLIWSTSYPDDDTRPHRYDSRVLDPVVLLGTRYGQNLTTSPQFQEGLRKFHRAWQVGAEWEQFLREQPPLLRLWPLHAGDCSEPDGCVGINWQGSCVCKEPAEPPHHTLWM